MAGVLSYPHPTLCLPDVCQPVKPVSSQPVNVTYIKGTSTVWRYRKKCLTCMMTYLLRLQCVMKSVLADGAYDTDFGYSSCMHSQQRDKSQLTTVINIHDDDHSVHVL